MNSVALFCPVRAGQLVRVLCVPCSQKHQERPHRTALLLVL